MGRKKTIKIWGVKGKRHTNFPFFSSSQDKEAIVLERIKKRRKLFGISIKK